MTPLHSFARFFRPLFCGIKFPIQKFCLLAALLIAAGCDRGSHPSRISGPAPDITVRDATTTVHLADYHGKIVLLNFWATWCQPCIDELPSLVSLQRQMPAVVVLAVSTDEDEAAYRQFLSDHKPGLITVRDARQQSNALYGTFRYPESYIIDRQGILRRKFVGAQDWTSPEIVKYLKGL